MGDCCSCGFQTIQIEIFYQGEPVNLKYTVLQDQTLEQLLLKLQQDDNFVETIDIQKSQFLGGKIVKKFKDQRPIKLLDIISDITYLNIKPPQDLEPQELIVNGVQLIQTQKMKFFNLKNNINRILEIDCTKSFNISSFWDQLMQLGLVSEYDQDIRFFEGVSQGVSIKILDKKEDLSEYQEILIRYKKKNPNKPKKLRKKSFSRILKTMQSDAESYLKTQEDSDIVQKTTSIQNLDLNANTKSITQLNSIDINSIPKISSDNLLNKDKNYSDEEDKNSDLQKKIKIDLEQCQNQQQTDNLSQNSYEINTKPEIIWQQKMDLIHQQDDMSTIRENSIESKLSNFTSMQQNNPNSLLLNRRSSFGQQINIGKKNSLIQNHLVSSPQNIKYITSNTPHKF